MFLSSLLLLSFLGMEAQARKMTPPVVYGKPWIETRLTYSITASELAQKYYGNTEEVSELIKANKIIQNAADMLTKDMIIHIPITNNFKEQPEHLGWASGKASDI
jgi:hypothetical protein